MRAQKAPKVSQRDLDLAARNRLHEAPAGRSGGDSACEASSCRRLAVGLAEREAPARAGRRLICVYAVTGARTMRSEPCGSDNNGFGRGSEPDRRRPTRRSSYHQRREGNRFGLGPEAPATAAAVVLPADDVLAAGRVVVDAHPGLLGLGANWGRKAPPIAKGVVTRNSPPPRRARPNQRKSPATRGLYDMRRRGLEPPPGYPGPGPQPGNPGVRSVRCVPDRPYRPGARTMRTHRTIWMLPRMLPRPWAAPTNHRQRGVPLVSGGAALDLALRPFEQIR
jgi:hypothetical protein